MIEKLNYKINKKFDFGNETINGQGVGKISQCRYGFFPMSYNGCEIIAVYNMCLLTGHPRQLCEIAEKIYPYGNVLSGLFGTYPSAIGRYFRKESLPEMIKEKDYYKFRSGFAGRQYAIITFWNTRTVFGGIHTVCIENVPDGVRIYNKTNKTAHPVVVKSLDHYMDSGRFICGYFAASEPEK